MGDDLTINVQGAEMARRAVEGLANVNRLKVTDRVGFYVSRLVADHLDEINGQAQHHKTIQRLGAVSSRFLETAAGMTSHKADEGGATVTVKNTPGLRRAFGPIDIKPVRRKWLTIPIHKVSYNRTVGELRDESGIDVFRLPGKDVLAGVLPGEGRGKKSKPSVRALYLLRKSVHQKQDRTLMPSDEDLQDRAVAAIRRELREMGIL